MKYRQINFLSELKIPVIYKDKSLNIDFRSDLYIENCLVIELKAVSEINNSFEAQLLTYMKHLKSLKGMVINFNCSNIFKYGQNTYVNDYFSQLPKK